MTDISFRKIECRSASGGLVQPYFTKGISRSCANECGVNMLQLRAAGRSPVQVQNALLPGLVQEQMSPGQKNERFPGFAHSFLRFGFCAGPVAVSIVTP
jgi:hypothetical protein